MVQAKDAIVAAIADHAHAVLENTANQVHVELLDVNVVAKEKWHQ